MFSPELPAFRRVLASSKKPWLYIPPPLPVVELSLIVLLLTPTCARLRGEGELYIPPPSPAELPLIVLLLMVTKALGLFGPPPPLLMPPPKSAELPLIVLLLMVTKAPPPNILLKMPPPSRPSCHSRYCS